MVVASLPVQGVTWSRRVSRGRSGGLCWSRVALRGFNRNMVSGDTVVVAWLQVQSVTWSRKEHGVR